jgi:hypothetical protein
VATGSDLVHSSFISVPRYRYLGGGSYEKIGIFMGEMGFFIGEMGFFIGENRVFTGENRDFL